MSPLPWMPLTTHVAYCPLPTNTLPPADATNAYLIHSDQEAVWVDAGSTNAALLETLVQQAADALGVTRITALFATHGHVDHIAGLPALQDLTSAPIYAHALDLPQVSRCLCREAPQVQPAPAEWRVGSCVVRIDHVPGHTHGHVHIRIPEDSVVLVGDHLTGTGSVWVGPPDGHMAAYYRALDAIERSGCTIAGPGHGAVFMDAAAAARQHRQRRLDREAAILRLLATRPMRCSELVQALYAGNIEPAAMGAARKTVLGHLEHLRDLGFIDQRFSPDEGELMYWSIAGGKLQPAGR
ncbi:MAG: MBL fold metallo-hydrolase [Alicyclobacillus sp.]|nr:MBL fold metallo-hydrolase [Alicyclobacillus sp.]